MCNCLKKINAFGGLISPLPYFIGTRDFYEISDLQNIIASCSNL